MTLAQAVERKEWPLVSLMLLLGVTEVAASLPPESLAALLDIVGEGRLERGGRHGHL